MTTEMAVLNIRSGTNHEFEAAFRAASPLIAKQSGYIKHSLQRCVERENQYLLLVEWQKLEDHTEGFRNSPEYAEWKKLLHHFYEPFPVVEHYALVYPRAEIS